MSINKLEGLKGLKGLSDLSDNERSEFYAKYENLLSSYKGDPINFSKAANTIYNNRRFIDKFGKEEFDKYDYKTRESMYRNSVVNDAIQVYKDDSRFSEIANMTTDGKIALLESDYLTDSEHQQKINEEKKIAKAAEDSKFSDFVYSSAVNANPTAYIAGETHMSRSESIKEATETLASALTEGRNSTLDAHISKDNIRKVEQSKPLSLQYLNAWQSAINNGELTAEELEAEFDKYIGDYSRHYKAFKDTDALEHFGTSEKMKALADFIAVSENFGVESALSAVDANIQNFVSDNQSGLDWALNTTKNVALKGTANLFNKYIGLRAVFMDNEERALYLQGLDTDGNELFWADNPLYWQGVDQYNTIDTNEIKKFSMNGGISPYQNITRAGEEMEFMSWKTLNDAASQLGYMWSEILASYAMRGAGKGLSAIAPALKASKFMRTTGALLDLGQSTIGMAEAEGLSSFQETLSKANEIIDTQVDKELAVKLNEAVNSNEFNDLVQAKIESIKAVNADKVSMYFGNALEEKAKELVLQDLAKEYRSQIEAAHEVDRKEAAKAATSAYMTTASIMSAKEAVTNGLLQQFMFNKGTRRALGDNGPKIDITTNSNGTVSASISTWNKYKGAITKPFVEFIEEVSDGAVNSFGQGFGLNQYLSYHNKEYNPEAYVEATDGILGSLVAGVSSGTKALLNPELFYEGFIGAVSGVGGVPVKIYQDISKAKGVSEQVKAVNEILKNHGSELQDIAGVMSTLYDYSSSIKANDTMAAVDSKQRQAFDLVNIITTLGNSEIASQSETYLTTMQTIEDLAKGKLSEEQTVSLVSQFLAQPKNKSIADKSNANELALNALTDNAKTLLKMKSEVNDIYDTLDNLSSKGTLTPEVKTELAYLKVMGKNWKERLNSIEKSIGSSKGAFNADAEYGSKKAYERKKEAMSSSIQKMKDKVKGIKELVDTKNKKKDKVAISALKLEEKALLSNIKKAEQGYKKLEKHAELFEDSNYSRTLSKEEILSLPASQRAWMLNPNNLSDYSPEQQTVIEELKSELTTKDPTLLQQIQDAAVLSSRIEEVNTAFSRVLNNPEEAFHYINALKDYRNSKLQYFYQQKYDDDVAKAFNGKSDEEAISAARDLPYSAISRYIEKNPEKKDLLSGVMEVSKLREDAVYASLPSLADGDTKAVKAINSIITDITKTSNNRTEAINAIEEAIDDESINSDTRSLLDEVLNKLQELDYQRNATKVENRAAKKARKEEKESKAKKQEEAKKAAEKSVQDDNKNKEFEVNKDGSNIITEEDPGIKSDGSNIQETIEVDESKTGSDIELKSIEGDVDLDGKIADLTAEEQVKNNPKARITQTIDKPSEEGTPTSLVGNVMARYNSTLLKEDKYQEKRKGKEENDPMNQFFSWMDTAGINYQEIIDDELSDIWSLDPDINFLMVNPQDNATKDKSMNDHVLLVVEYTPEVANIHKESRGGVLNANGKRWLVIGTLGFGEYENQKDSYGALKYELKKRRFQYMNSNPGERFYVDSFYSTKIESIDAGLITRKLEGDSEVKIRKISELLNEESRNPKGIESLSDLKWGIQTDTGFITVNTSSRDRVHSPMNSLDNSGNTFILIEAANGDYIPVAIKPVMYNELQDSRLKTQIDDLLVQLTSPDHPERLAAIKKLRHLLVLTDEKNILIGNEEYNTLTVVDNGNKKTFNLNDPLLNRKDFLDSILGAKFRINITTSSLSSPTSLEILDEANCLSTDIAKLGTSNAGFSVYSVGTDGKPKIADSVPANYNTGNSSNTRETSVIILGQVYRKKKDSWVDAKDNLVTDPRLLDQIKYNHIIQSRELEPIESSGNYDYFVIDQDINNPIVVKQNKKDHTIVIPSKDQAIEYINRMAKKEAAKKAQEAINKAVVNEESLVDVNLEDETITQDELFDSMTGKHTEETEDKKSESEPLVQNTVDDINKTGTKSLAELQANKTLDSFIGILSDSKFGVELDSIIDEKIESGAWDNVPDDMNQLSKYLEEKGIPITGITDVVSWLDMIKNCK